MWCGEDLLGVMFIWLKGLAKKGCFGKEVFGCFVKCLFGKRKVWLKCLVKKKVWLKCLLG